MEKRDFKGIWIPKEVWLSDKLTLQEKVFLVEINSLDNEDGCYANNRYFAKFFDISITRVSEVINSLVEKGYVESFVKAEEGNKRILKTLLKESLRPSYRKVEDPLKDSFKHNNTLSNSSSNTPSNSATTVASLEDRKQDFMERLTPFVGQYGKEMLRAFFDYWTEHNEGGRKMRFEMQRVFHIQKRLMTWARNDKNKFNGRQKGFDADATLSAIYGNQ
jgi:hypothetical protein